MTLTFLSPSVICPLDSNVFTGVLESRSRPSTANPILKSQFWHTLSTCTSLTMMPILVVADIMLLSLTLNPSLLQSYCTESSQRFSRVTTK